jgi:hypothetical protein
VLFHAVDVLSFGSLPSAGQPRSRRPRRVIVTHEAFSPGDPCPQCQDGTLYRSKDGGIEVRLVRPPASSRAEFPRPCSPLSRASLPKIASLVKFGAFHLFAF